MEQLSPARNIELSPGKSVAARRLVACSWILLVGHSLALAQSQPKESPLPEFDPQSALRTEPQPLPGSPHMTEFLGSQSCSSVSCHGNPRRVSVSGSAANYFLNRDKHQFAGTVLYDDRSQAIARRLNLPQPWKARECLVCHAPGAAGEVDRQEFTIKLADGVGCESCHGAARQWVSTHRTAEWKQLDVWSSQQKELTGFRDTKSLLSRVNICADCHVGNGAQSVTHDLIAAGHPRLNFEYSAYQSLMPAHWQRSADRKQTPASASLPGEDRSTYEATTWLLGQLVNAEHELDILSSAARNTQSSWPELAQYDCFGCHHDLSSPSWRQTRSAWKLRPGELQWGTWSLGLIEDLQQQWPESVPPSVAAGQAQLVQVMRKIPADRSETLAAMAGLRRELSATTIRLSQTSLSADDVSKLRDALLSENEQLTDQGWDRSTQLFLAVVALDKGAADARGAGNRVDPARQEALLRLRELLAFRDRPATALGPRWESPRQLPANRSEIRQQFQRLQVPDLPALESSVNIRPAEIGE